jgi:acyl-coenzyme A synthetase/AMP-(fatty) acid ligase
MVKIRGHRLDLGEVEAALKRHPAVRDAVAFAIAVAPGEVEIRAVVLTEDATDGDAELGRLCRRHLPSHARPARIIALAQFPLLPTGKLDRRRLKAIAGQP